VLYKAHEDKQGGSIPLVRISSGKATHVRIAASQKADNLNTIKNDGGRTIPERARTVNRF